MTEETQNDQSKAILSLSQTLLKLLKAFINSVSQSAHFAPWKDFMGSFAPLTSEDVFADLGSGRGAVPVQVEDL